MLLQVQRVSTVISHTGMRWENAIEKLKMRFKCGFRFRFRLEIGVASMGKLGAPDTENALKQQSNDTQGTAMHSGLLSKKTH